MKASNLHDLWASPDNNRLTSKQFSFRLPTHIAAKIAALCDMFPSKNRTQIVADLLSSALDELEKNLPVGLGSPMGEFGQNVFENNAMYLGEPIPTELYYSLGGAKGQFHALANRYFKDYEIDLGNESPTPLYQKHYISESYLDQD